MKIRRSVNLTILMSLVPFLVPGSLMKSEIVSANRGELYEFLNSCSEFLKPDPAYDKSVSFVLVSNDWSQRVEYTEGTLSIAISASNGMQSLRGDGTQYLNSNRYSQVTYTDPFDPAKTEKKAIFINFSQTRVEVLVDGVKIVDPLFLPAKSLVGTTFSGAICGHEEIPDNYDDMAGTKPYRFTYWVLSVSKQSNPHKPSIPKPDTKKIGNNKTQEL